MFTVIYKSLKTMIFQKNYGMWLNDLLQLFACLNKFKTNFSGSNSMISKFKYYKSIVFNYLHSKINGYFQILKVNIFEYFWITGAVVLF